MSLHFADPAPLGNEINRLCQSPSLPVHPDVIGRFPAEGHLGLRRHVAAFGRGDMSPSSNFLKFSFDAPRIRTNFQLRTGAIKLPAMEVLEDKRKPPV